MSRAIAESSPLPATYAAAKVAIEKCARVDECKDWADKAKALAIYAKQSKDKTLEHNAIRIRARAVKRCGQLIAATPKATGKRKSTGTHTFSRREEATRAGLSKQQQDQAVRVARVPEQQFEQQVESDQPPTIESLAKQGVHPHPLAPGFDRADMDAGRRLWGVIWRAQSEAENVKLEQALRGMTPYEIAVTIERGETLLAWLKATLLALKGVMRDGEKGKSERKAGAEDHDIPADAHN